MLVLTEKGKLDSDCSAGFCTDPFRVAVFALFFDVGNGLLDISQHPRERSVQRILFFSKRQWDICILEVLLTMLLGFKIKKTGFVRAGLLDQKAFVY